MRLSCVPLSTTLPSRTTRMLSADWMVDSRWATTKQVLWAISSRMACCTTISVRVSTLEVASSRMSMGVSMSMARAMVSSCFCPLETLAASSARMVS